MKRRLHLLALFAVLSAIEFCVRWAREWCEEQLKEKPSDGE